jgi:hypothetical protein
MPYQRASSRRPDAILTEWQGTCSGKHYLLDQVYRELGLETKVVMCTHRFIQENSAHLPEELRALLTQGPVPDIHTFLLVRDSHGWTRVDATWPTSAGLLGMTVNREYRPGTDMKLACDPIDFYDVPDGMDPQEFKESLIESFCGAQSDTRERFIVGLGEWLGKHTSW